jgi:hypothetical protein
MIEKNFLNIIEQNRINKEQYNELTLEQKDKFIEHFFSNEKCHSNMINTQSDEDVLYMMTEELINKIGCSFFQEIKYTHLFFSVIRSYYYNTPVEKTREKEIFDLVKLGFKHGMDINIEEAKYKNPLLHYVIGYGYLEITKWLVEKGVNINVVDGTGDDILSTILDHCEEQDEKELCQSFEYAFNLPQVNRKLSPKYLAIALANEFESILSIIRASEVVEDSQFIQNALDHLGFHSEEASMWMERNQLNEKINKNRPKEKERQKI